MSYYNTQGSSSTSGGNYYGSQQQQPPPSSSSYQQQQQHQSNYTNEFHDGYGDPSTWQQKQQQQQQQQYGQQPQQSYPMQSQPLQQQPNAMNSFWDPATAAKMAAMAVNMTSAAAASNGTGTSSNETMMFNLAGEAGKSFLQSKSAQLLPSYMEQIMNVLRTYFAVDNRYVVLKMKRIIFPFLCKHWKRQVFIYKLIYLIILRSIHPFVVKISYMIIFLFLFNSLMITSLFYRIIK
jgi:hypothetical protein